MKTYNVKIKAEYYVNVRVEDETQIRSAALEAVKNRDTETEVFTVEGYEEIKDPRDVILETLEAKAEESEEPLKSSILKEIERIKGFDSEPETTTDTCMSCGKELEEDNSVVFESYDFCDMTCAFEWKRS